MRVFPDLFLFRQRSVFFSFQPGVTNCHHIFCTVCLNMWGTKKKECPICRATITSVHKVNAIDDFITAATGAVSDKAYAERLQVMEDRKST